MEKIFFEDLFETVANLSSLQLVLELEPSEKVAEEISCSWVDPPTNSELSNEN